MPLSEDEQRKLDEIERALYRDDPRFGAGQSIERLRRRRTVTPTAAFLLGTVLLAVGLVTRSMALWLGEVITLTGFVVMLGVAAGAIPRRHPRAE